MVIANTVRAGSADRAQEGVEFGEMGLDMPSHLSFHVIELGADGPEHRLDNRAHQRDGQLQPPALGIMGRSEKLDMAAIEARLNRAAWLDARNAGCAARPRLAGGLRRFFAASGLLVLACLLAAGCASLPTDAPRAPSVAFQDHESTVVGRRVAKDAALRPGQSSFGIMPYGHLAFTARIALADLVQSSIDAQCGSCSGSGPQRRRTAPAGSPLPGGGSPSHWGRCRPRRRGARSRRSGARAA